MGTIKNIFKEHGPAYLDRYGDRMPRQHKKVIRAIINCKTDVFGVVFVSIPAMIAASLSICRSHAVTATVQTVSTEKLASG